METDRCWQIRKTLMTESDVITSGFEILRPRARIMRTLGDELISSEVVAIIELVKNAYDADATRVLVRFNSPLEIGNGSIEVIDNGHGMDLTTIRTTWMEPATLHSKQQTHSKKYKRRVLGEKGIGRFAASRLANFLQIVSRFTGTDEEVRALFDWSQFDVEGKYLDEVEVLWEQTRPSDISPGGTIESLWQMERDKPDPDELTHGTILRMEGLRVNWEEPQIEKVQTGLSRLVSPYETIGDFQIRMELPELLSHLSGIVEPVEILRHPHYFIRGQVDRTGSYNLKLSLRGESNEQNISGKFTLTDALGNVKMPYCGPFEIELRVWDRREEDLEPLAELYGSTVKQIRDDLDKSAGISIYRDGFRILPYGERGNDWLRLDSRRVQRPTGRLSNNQIVGFLHITADRNPDLRDQSNREGLMTGPALDDLKDLVIDVLNELEWRRYKLRRHPKKIEEEGASHKGLFTDFTLDALREQIAKRHPNDTELLTIATDKSKELQLRVGRVQEVLSRYHRLATLGQLIDTVLHDGINPLKKIRDTAELGLLDIDKKKRDYYEFIRAMKSRLETIEKHSNILSTVFRKIEPFGGRKRGKPEPISLEIVIADAFAVLEEEKNRLNVNVTLPKTDTKVTVDKSEIQIIIVNLLQNSLYWLREIPREKREIFVSVEKIEPDGAAIVFSDSGKGVNVEARDYIFDPYFSTKPDGVGLGLTIAGEILSEYYEGTLELLDGGPLPGATFRITLHGRV